MPKLTFSGGVHPLPKEHHGKVLSSDKPIEVMPASALMSIPISGHLGTSAVPVVAVGDTVKVGQVVAEPGGFISVPVHASVSGKIKEIKSRPNKIGVDVVNIVIENDFLDAPIDGLGQINLDELDADGIKKLVASIGLVGLGGAGFPTHVKLSPPPDKKIDTVILNGAECEPYLTADYRLMLETPKKVVLGMKAAMLALGVKNGIIAIEDNKLDAAANLKKAIGDDTTMKVVILETKYPQGSEKQIIEAVVKRKVPSGKLPMDVGVVVVNVGSCAAIADKLRTGMPVIDRIVTVSGLVKNPKNLKIRIGTPIADVIDFCGGFKEDVKRFIAGGPMMGVTLDSLNYVVTKTTSGLLALDDSQIFDAEKTSCIKCGRCADACPIKLMPMMLAARSEISDWEACNSLNAMDCMTCGCCSYVCPAKRDLAWRIKLAKDEISKKRSVQK